MTKATLLIILAAMTLSGCESYGGAYSSRDASTNDYASDSY